MPSSVWTAPVPPLGYADGPTVNTAALVDGSPVPPILVPPISNTGVRLRVKAQGNYSTSATSSTIVWGVYWSTPTTVIGSATVIAATSAISWLSTSSVLWPWQLEYEGEFRALSTVVGTATGSIKGQGFLLTPASLIAFNAPLAFPITQALRTVSVDTSQTMKCSLGVTLGSVSTGAPAVICEHLSVELLG